MSEAFVIMPIGDEQLDEVPGGPKVHFDLVGYDILYWSPSRLHDFRQELEKRIRRRQLLLAGAPGPRSR